MARAPEGRPQDLNPGGPETTRPSLLVRIRDAGDREAWRQFVDLYAPLIYGLARKRGLQDADAADVTQEVFRAVANRMASNRESAARNQGSEVASHESGAWEYDPKRGSFRSWLYTVTRRKISDFLTSRKPFRGTGDTATQMFLEEQPATEDEETAWGREYQQRLFTWAAERIRGDFHEATWKAFWQVAVEGKSGEEAARNLRMSVGAVYVAKSRVLARLKQEIEELQKE
jgi:RNA polymerase sigma factor (sigma-70 family)